jgi:hypothetical protein
MTQKDKTVTIGLPSGKTLQIAWDRARAEKASADDVVSVFDDRHTGNPSFQIRRSFRVRRKEERLEVLRALLEYDAAHPSDPPWQRTLGSLEREWALHNLAYRIGFLRSRARDADLDNHAEGRGALKYFIKAAWGVICRK